MKVLAAILVLSATLFAATPWTAATFRGLTLGRAHREDAVRAFGNPDAASRTTSGEELSYKSRGDHKGDVTVRINASGIVTDIQESFPVAIPRTQIYKELGRDAQTAHFSWAKCAGNALYRDPRGPLELTMYPSRGIVLWTDQVGYDFAAIHYMAQPPGLVHPPPCAAGR